MASVAELDVLIRYQEEGKGVLGALTGETLGAAAAIGGLYEIGKSALDNYEKQQRAAKDLSQAFWTQGQTVPTNEIQAFLDKNKAFISDQYDAEKAIATAMRAGISWKDTQLLMQDALDLSIAKSEPMSQAMDTLVKAAAGGRAQLADLGITSKELSNDTNAVTNAQKVATDADQKKAQADRDLKEGLDKINEAHKITTPMLDHLQDLKAKDLAATQASKKAHDDLAAAQSGSNASADRALILHGLLHPKLQDETNTVTDLQQHQHELNTDWQDFSAKIGPVVSMVVDGITQALDAALQGIMAIGDQLGNIGSWLNSISNFGATVTGGRGNPRSRPGARQFGGQVFGDQSFLVGEAGPELLTLGQGMSGSVTPNDRLGGMTDMTESNQYLGQIVDLLAALVDSSSGGLGYSTIARLEYSRSRGYGV